MLFLACPACCAQELNPAPRDNGCGVHTAKLLIFMELINKWHLGQNIPSLFFFHCNDCVTDRLIFFFLVVVGTQGIQVCTPCLQGNNFKNITGTIWYSLSESTKSAVIIELGKSQFKRSKEMCQSSQIILETFQPKKSHLAVVGGSDMEDSHAHFYPYSLQGFSGSDSSLSGRAGTGLLLVPGKK